MLLAALVLALLALVAGWVRPAEVPGPLRSPRTFPLLRPDRGGRVRQEVSALRVRRPRGPRPAALGARPGGVGRFLALAALGRDARRTDFTLVAVFAALLVGVEGLRRSALFRALDPLGLFGASPSGFVLSGALLSQAVSNVPAALLLAPAAAAAPAGAFTALLYGVNAGGCGTKIASLANLIGARLYLAGRSSRRAFWRLFAATSAALLVLAVALSLALVKYSGSTR